MLREEIIVDIWYVITFITFVSMVAGHYIGKHIDAEFHEGDAKLLMAYDLSSAVEIIGVVTMAAYLLINYSAFKSYLG